MASFEAEATEIRNFSPAVIPGSLQTEDYARAIMHQFETELRPEEIEARIAARTRRRDALRRRNPRPRLFVMFDESVLLRKSAGPTPSASSSRPRREGQRDSA